MHLRSLRHELELVCLTMHGERREIQTFTWYVLSVVDERAAVELPLGHHTAIVVEQTHMSGGADAADSAERSIRDEQVLVGTANDEFDRIARMQDLGYLAG